MCDFSDQLQTKFLSYILILNAEGVRNNKNLALIFQYKNSDHLLYLHSLLGVHGGIKNKLRCPSA
jgi:hypothetical protein